MLDTMYIIFYMVSDFLGMTYQPRGAATTAREPEIHAPSSSLTQMFRRPFPALPPPPLLPRPPPRAFPQGPAKVDVAASEQKSFAIFRDFGASRGMKPDAMQDHLKLIPRQMVQIVKEDPHVLDSYDNFIAAGFGPR